MLRGQGSPVFFSSVVVLMVFSRIDIPSTAIFLGPAVESAGDALVERTRKYSGIFGATVCGKHHTSR